MAGQQRSRALTVEQGAALDVEIQYMPRTVRVVAMSDSHNLHRRVEIPPGDILLHAGDITAQGDLKDLADFDAFLGTLPHRHKIVIAGNHDFCFEQDPGAAQALMRNAIYLEDAAVTVEGIKIYGSPWQPWFYDWAFNLPRGEALREKWALIPEDVDILVTHGPPRGHLDLTTAGDSAGCDDLRARVEAVRPAYHVFGHIHEGYGMTRDAHTTYVNACVCTVAYKPWNRPLVFDFVVPRASPPRGS